MIVVKVELWSALNGQKTELARMTICNDGTGDVVKRNYDVATMRGRDQETLMKAMMQRSHTRTGKVAGHRSQAVHIWNLVAKALAAMGYDQ